MKTLMTFDWFVIISYFLAVFGIAFWATLKEKTDRETSKDYFLASRNMGWFVIGSSLFASNIGSEHLIGLAGTGAASGIAVGQFEILASLILLLLGWVFVPFYLKSGVYTMPEFLEKRYSASARWYLAIISIVGYVLTKISVTIAAGGIVFETLMGVNFWTGAIFIVIATGLYTIFGGLRAVLYTDMMQMFVLIGGAIAVTCIGLNEIGGWSEMIKSAKPGTLTLWKPLTDPNFPWTGILFGAPILGVWYWCTDQFIVQRVLSAKNIDQARKGTFFGGYLKILPLFIFVIPGVIASILAQQGKMTLPTSDQALPMLVQTLLPIGVRGLVVAGLLAALMSSLSSVFNSCSTLVTWDIYKKLKPEASEKRLVLVGQISTAILVAFGLAWIPLMKYISGQLYQYLQSVQAYISPPIAAVFLLGLLWKRLNSQGAIASLIAGFVLGIGRLVLELNKNSLSEGLLLNFATINFLHFALFLFAICSTILIFVSLITPSESEDKLTNLTFGTLKTKQTKMRQNPSQIALTIGLLILVGVVWWYFS